MRIKLHNSIVYLFENENHCSEEGKSFFFFTKEKAILCNIHSPKEDEMNWEFMEFPIHFIKNKDEIKEISLPGDYFILDITENNKLLLKNGKKMVKIHKPFLSFSSYFVHLPDEEPYLILPKYSKWIVSLAIMIIKMIHKSDKQINLI